MHDVFEIALLDEGIYITSSSGSGKVVWTNIYQWRQNARYVLIYPMPRLYYIVPKSIASQGLDIALLTEKLTRHVGNPA